MKKALRLVLTYFLFLIIGTVLGMFWSLLSPLLQLLIMRLVFTSIFADKRLYYSTYLFSGLIIFNYYAEATKGSISALSMNRSIILKIRTPKYLFLLSRNVSALINFLIIIPIYLLFAALDGIPFHLNFFTLLYPVILCYNLVYYLFILSKLRAVNARNEWHNTPLMRPDLL